MNKYNKYVSSTNNVYVDNDDNDIDIDIDNANKYSISSSTYNPITKYINSLELISQNLNTDLYVSTLASTVVSYATASVDKLYKYNTNNTNNKKNRNV